MEQEIQHLYTLEVVHSIMDEIVHRGAEMLYLKYIDSKLDAYSLDNALNAISSTFEGGFIQHDAGELLVGLDETPMKFKSQQENGQFPRLQTLKEQQHSFLEEEQESVSREIKGLENAKGGEFDRFQHQWMPLKEPVRLMDQQEPAKIDSNARMALTTEKVPTLKKTDSLIGKIKPTKRPTHSQASSHKGAAAQRQTRESAVVPPSSLRINPIRIEQDELIEEDEKVQRLREWKLAQIREQEEENRRREERQATQRKNVEKQRKLLELMKRQTITYDSKGSVLGVKKLASTSSMLNKLKGLDFEVEKKLTKNSGRRETQEEISSARQDKTRGSITQSQDDPFVCDRRHFAGSNFGLLQPNYGVQIKENQKVKTGSFAFKEHFQVMSRAEYEAECVMGIKERAVPLPNEYSTIKEERGETTKMLEGSIQVQDIDVNNLRVDLPPPNYALSSDKYSTLPCAEINRKKRSSSKPEVIKDQEYQTFREETQLPNFMRSTMSTKGIGKSPRLEAIDTDKYSTKKSFKIKLINSNDTVAVKKPQKHESEFSKLLKQASEPNLGRTTMFFESEKKIKNRQLLVHQKSLTRDRSQPSLVARTLKTGKPGKIKKAVYLPPLPPPPIGRTLGHGVINDISRISQI